MPSESDSQEHNHERERDSELVAVHIIHKNGTYINTPTICSSRLHLDEIDFGLTEKRFYTGC